jgi:O-antigen/teichoic acid export membrane protein
MLRKLVSNTIVGFGGTAALKGLTFVTTLVLARGLGQDGFGIYSFVGVYMFFFGFLVDLGMERVVTRELARAPARVASVLGNAILLKLGLCIVVAPATYVVARLVGIQDEALYCILIAAFGLPLSVELMFRSYLQSQYDMKYAYAVSLPSGLMFLLLVGLCVHWGLPVHAVYYAALLNGGLALGVLLCITLPRVRPTLRPEREVLTVLVRDAGEVGLFVLLFVVAWRIDQILLFKMRGAVEVGHYAVAVKVTEALSLLPEALMLTVFPLLAASQHSAPERFHHTYRLSFKYLAAIILPIALVLTLTRQEFVRLVFGASYIDSAPSLAILAWGSFFAYTGAVYLNLFIVQRLQRLLVIVSAVAAVVNIACNLWLIPAYGATGAAMAMLIGNVAGFACWALHPTTAPFIAACVAESVRPLAGVAIGWLAAAALSLDGVIAAAIALAIYAVVMTATGGFSRSDLELVRQLFAAEHAT